MALVRSLSGTYHRIWAQVYLLVLFHPQSMQAPSTCSDHSSGLGLQPHIVHSVYNILSYIIHLTNNVNSVF